jgi:hypothetical protein
VEDTQFRYLRPLHGTIESEWKPTAAPKGESTKAVGRTKGIYMHRSVLLCGFAALALALALNASPAWAGDTLIINGKTASTDVRIIGGSAYVKLADVAKALGMVVTKRADGTYEIAKAGGTNQVQGAVQGKVGDVLFDGRWRFQVLGVQMPDSYTMNTPSAEPTSYPADTLLFDRTTHVVRAKPGYKLVIVPCRMTGGDPDERPGLHPAEQRLHEGQRCPRIAHAGKARIEAGYSRLRNARTPRPAGERWESNRAITQTLTCPRLNMQFSGATHLNGL